MQNDRGDAHAKLDAWLDYAEKLGRNGLEFGVMNAGTFPRELFQLVRNAHAAAMSAARNGAMANEQDR